MNEKVKLTKEQAEAIKKWINKEQLIIAKASGLLEHGTDESIAELTMEQLVKALYIGYEVEPEFKVGDWVVNTSNGYIKLIENEREANFLNNDYIKYRELRHATSVEIAEEKERRWWARHGREVWELKRGDILSFHESLEVYNIEEAGHNFIFVNGANGKVRYKLEQVKKLFKIACFAEDRKDI